MAISSYSTVSFIKAERESGWIKIDLLNLSNGKIFKNVNEIELRRINW